MNRLRIVRGVTIAIVLWIFITLVLFYWVQKPFAPANAAAILRTILDGAAATLIWVSGWTLGGQLLRIMRLPGLSVADRFVLGTGLGLGLLGLLTFGLGLLGLLSRWLFWGMMLAVAVFLLMRDEIADSWQALRRTHRPRRGTALYIGATLLLSLLTALTPPTDWDGLFYHLTGPAWTLMSGRISPLPVRLPHLSFPGLMESLFLLAMVVQSDVTAKLIHWGFALLLGGLTYQLTERYVGVKWGWQSVVVLYAIPMVAVLAGWAYNDLALAFFQIAALYAVLNGRAQPGGSLRWFGLAGAFAGLAMGVKYTSFVCPLALMALALWDAVRKEAPWAAVLRRVAVFGCMAGVVASPWYVRNLAFTGNPVYPFAYRLFDGHGWSAWLADWYAQSGTGLGTDWGAILALPVTATLGLRDMNYYDGRTGPLFLIALPALLWTGVGERRKPPAVTALLWFALAHFVVWTVGVIESRSLFQSRLLLTGLVALCPVLVYIAHRLHCLDRPGFSLHRFIRLVLVIVLAFNLVVQGLEVISLHPLAYLVGEESRDDFLVRRLGGYYLAMQAVATLPDDARVQFLWEPRSYYSQRVLQPDPILETWKYLCETHHRDITAIAADWREQGVTHILLHQAGMELVARTHPAHLTEADLAAWEAFSARYLSSVWELPGSYVLYQWNQWKE